MLRCQAPDRSISAGEAVALASPLVNRLSDETFELGGYGLWLVGSALFAIASWRADDMTAFAGSLLFFVGIIFVMVPMARRARR